MLLGMTNEVSNSELLGLLERLQFVLSADKRVYICPECACIMSGTRHIGHSDICTLAKAIVQFGGAPKMQDDLDTRMQLC